MARLRTQQRTFGSATVIATPNGRRQQPLRACKTTTPARASVQPASAAPSHPPSPSPSPSRSPSNSASRSPSSTHSSKQSSSGHDGAWDAGAEQHMNEPSAANDNSSEASKESVHSAVADHEDPETEASDIEESDSNASDAEDLGSQGVDDIEHPGPELINAGDMVSIKQLAILAPVCLLLVGALIMTIRQSCIYLFQPPPKFGPSSLPSQCLRSSADLPLLPAGCRAPLSAMAMTLALYPDYSLTWLLEAVPIGEPQIDAQVLKDAASDLKKAVRSDYGHTRSHSKLLHWWWDRLLLASNHTTPIAEHVTGALAIRLMPFWKRAGLRVLCLAMPLLDSKRCAAQIFLLDPVQTGFLGTSLAGVARRACLQPGLQLNVTRSQSASRYLQMQVLAAVQEIADRASDDFSAHVQSMSRAELSLLPDALELSPTVQAPWSPRDPRSTRRHRIYSLRNASMIAGTQIPSKSDQQTLHALAALYAKALFFDLVASFMHSLNSAIQNRCHFAVDITSSVEMDVFNRLLPFVLGDSIGQAAPDADPLVRVLLNMTHSAFLHLQKNVDEQGGAAFPLLQPLTATEPIHPDVDDHGYEEAFHARDHRTAKSFIGETAPDLHGRKDSSAVKASPRKIFDQAWKSTALAEARIWGKMRSDQPYLSKSFNNSMPMPRPAWLQCLAPFASSGKSAWSPSRHALAQALATQAVWAFWQTGATPEWYTYDHPFDGGQAMYNNDRPSGSAGQDGENHEWTHFANPGEGNGSPLYPRVEREDPYIGALEVNMEHVFGWGLNSD